MKRWRTVGFIGKPTADGRVIEGPVTVRLSPIPLMEVLRDGDGAEYALYHGTKIVTATDARVKGDEIQAFLDFKHRHANLDLRVTDYTPSEDMTVIGECQVIGLTLSGPSAWAELRQ